MKDLIELVNEEGTVEKFYIVEETKVGGSSYILVAESEEDEADAYILKDVSAEEDDEAEYLFVDDEDELEAVAGVFREMLEDIDLQ